jgi:hypothetical protein
MTKLRIFLFLSLAFISVTGYSKDTFYTHVLTGSDQDTINDNQILYNGRVWRKLFYNVVGDEFLYTGDFLQGSVTIGGKTFRNIKLKYDIVNDEILSVTNYQIIYQVNKEMTEGFTLDFENITRYFKNIDHDSLKDLSGYVNVVYDGRSPVYVKYRKVLDPLGVDNKYDTFFQTYKIYVVVDSVVYNVRNRRQILDIAGEDKQTVKNFIRKNKIYITKKDPSSFVPVMKFYDTLNH